MLKDYIDIAQNDENWDKVTKKRLLLKRRIGTNIIKKTQYHVYGLDNKGLHK